MMHVIEEDRVVPMPAVAGWTEDRRLAHMAAIRTDAARQGAQIISERRTRNPAFDGRGERTTWAFTVRYAAAHPSKEETVNG